MGYSGPFLAPWHSGLFSGFMSHMRRPSQKRGGGESILEESQRIILSNDQLIVLPLNVTTLYRATQL